MFIGALFTIAKICKHLHTMEYYSDIKKNEIMPSIAWIGLEINILNELIHRKSNIIWYHSYVESKRMIQGFPGGLVVKNSVLSLLWLKFTPRFGSFHMPLVWPKKTPHIQKQKNKNKKWYKWTYLQNGNGLTDTENKLMVTKVDSRRVGVGQRAKLGI